MRRRRQKNPLLMRIIIISIAAHVVLLPILAHFGAFKKIQQHFVDVSTAVRLPPPAPEKARAEAKKPQKATPKVAKAKRGPTASHARQATQKSNSSTPKVVATSAGPGGAGSGPTVDNTNANGKLGEVPKDETNTTAPKVKALESMPIPKQPEQAKPEPTKEVARVEPIVKAPLVAKPEPKAPVFTEAAPAMAVEQEPKPSIPDDLRADALDKTCVVRFTVGPNGNAIKVEIAQSSGSDELDRAALDAAKQWRFKPATRDGEPVESQVNLHIEFQVS